MRLKKAFHCGCKEVQPKSFIGGHMRLRTLAIALGLVTSVAGPGQAREVAQEPSVELPAELGRVLTDYETAWRARFQRGGSRRLSC